MEPVSKLERSMLLGLGGDTGGNAESDTGESYAGEKRRHYPTSHLQGIAIRAMHSVKSKKES